MRDLEEELNRFRDQLNVQHPAIQFSREYEVSYIPYGKERIQDEDIESRPAQTGTSTNP